MAGASSDELLRLRDLRVDFEAASGAVHALQGVSLSLRAGEAVALVGESGSGKSVCALSVMGLLPRNRARVAGGEIVFEGVDLLGLSSRALRRVCGRRIAMVFQDPLNSLNPVHTVGAQIDEMLRRHCSMGAREARKETIALMQRVQIPDAGRRADSYPHEFSGGMRQRAMIAIALALHPRLLIADEPTTALDVTVQAEIIDLLAALRREDGTALLFITHDLGVVASLADRVAVMYAGRIVEEGPLREMYTAPLHPYTAGLLAALPDRSVGETRLRPIPGRPPDLAALPTGCSFAPRCQYAEPRCSEAVPALCAVGPTRATACLRWQAVAQQLADEAGLRHTVQGDRQ